MANVHKIPVHVMAARDGPAISDYKDLVFKTIPQ